MEEKQGAAIAIGLSLVGAIGLCVLAGFALLDTSRDRVLDLVGVSRGPGQDFVASIPALFLFYGAVGLVTFASVESLGATGGRGA